MFGIPAPTEFDVRFQLFGVPTRINPFFWVMAAFLGANLRDGPTFVLWIVAVLISILVHEFGHALTGKLFGEQPSVILHGFGGLCTSGGVAQTVRQRFLVLLMGPIAGFLFLTAVILSVAAFQRVSPLTVWELEIDGTAPFLRFLSFLFYINLIWGLINLLPVFPLDGGQIALLFISHWNRRNGVRWSFIVSLVTGGLVAIFLAQREQYMSAIMFGYLGFQSYQTLQSLQQQGTYSDPIEADDDWWKR